MRCLVTGGAGFIGSHTVDALLNKGFEVKILDNLSEHVHLKGKPGYLSPDVEFILGDVRNKDDWRKALKNVDVVFHLAAHHSYLPDFSKFFYTNCVGTALLYETIVEEKLDVQKIIVASSQAVYGEGKYRCPRCNRIKYPDLRVENHLKMGHWDIYCDECHNQLQAMWTNENRVNPQNHYAISKYSQEVMSMMLAKRYNIPTCCLRYSVVQGPRQSIYNAYTGICRIFCLCHFFDKQPVIYEDGLQLRDFIHIKDVVEANMVVLESCKANYKVFNIGGGKTYTILEFSEIVSNVFGKNITPKITSEFRFGDTRHIFSDISRLRELGWKPQSNPNESVDDYIKWLEQLEDKDNILSEAECRMKSLNIIRKSKGNNSNTISKPGKENKRFRRGVKITANRRFN